MKRLNYDNVTDQDIENFSPEQIEEYANYNRRTDSQQMLDTNKNIEIPDEIITDQELDGLVLESELNKKIEIPDEIITDQELDGLVLESKLNENKNTSLSSLLPSTTSFLSPTNPDYMKIYVRNRNSTNLNSSVLSVPNPDKSNKRAREESNVVSDEVVPNNISNDNNNNNNNNNNGNQDTNIYEPKGEDPQAKKIRLDVHDNIIKNIDHSVDFVLIERILKDFSIHISNLVYHFRYNFKWAGIAVIKKAIDACFKYLSMSGEGNYSIISKLAKMKPKEREELIQNYNLRLIKCFWTSICLSFTQSGQYVKENGFYVAYITTINDLASGKISRTKFLLELFKSICGTVVSEIQDNEDYVYERLNGIMQSAFRSSSVNMYKTYIFDLDKPICNTENAETFFEIETSNKKDVSLILLLFFKYAWACHWIKSSQQRLIFSLDDSVIQANESFLGDDNSFFKLQENGITHIGYNAMSFLDIPNTNFEKPKFYIHSDRKSRFSISNFRTTHNENNISLSTYSFNPFFGFAKNYMMNHDNSFISLDQYYTNQMENIDKPNMKKDAYVENRYFNDIGIPKANVILKGAMFYLNHDFNKIVSKSVDSEDSNTKKTNYSLSCILENYNFRHKLDIVHIKMSWPFILQCQPQNPNNWISFKLKIESKVFSSHKYDKLASFPFYINFYINTNTIINRAESIRSKAAQTKNAGHISFEASPLVIYEGDQFDANMINAKLNGMDSSSVPSFIVSMKKNTIADRHAKFYPKEGDMFESIKINLLYKEFYRTPNGDSNTSMSDQDTTKPDPNMYVGCLNLRINTLDLMIHYENNVKDMLYNVSSKNNIVSTELYDIPFETKIKVEKPDGSSSYITKNSVFTRPIVDKMVIDNSNDINPNTNANNSTPSNNNNNTNGDDNKSNPENRKNNFWSMGKLTPWNFFSPLQDKIYAYIAGQENPTVKKKLDEIEALNKKVKKISLSNFSTLSYDISRDPLYSKYYYIYMSSFDYPTSFDPLNMHRLELNSIMTRNYLSSLKLSKEYYEFLKCSLIKSMHVLVSLMLKIKQFLPSEWMIWNIKSKIELTHLDKAKDDINRISYAPEKKEDKNTAMSTYISLLKDNISKSITNNFDTLHSSVLENHVGYNKVIKVSDGYTKYQGSIPMAIMSNDLDDHSYTGRFVASVQTAQLANINKRISALNYKNENNEYINYSNQMVYDLDLDIASIPLKKGKIDDMTNSTNNTTLNQTNTNFGNAEIKKDGNDNDNEESIKVQYTIDRTRDIYYTSNSLFLAEYIISDVPGCYKQMMKAAPILFALNPKNT